MSKRILYVLKYVGFMVFAVIILIPIGIYWIITGDTRPLDWVERNGQRSQEW